MDDYGSDAAGFLWVVLGVFISLIIIFTLTSMFIVPSDNRKAKSAVEVEEKVKVVEKVPSKETPNVVKIEKPTTERNNNPQIAIFIFISPLLFMLVVLMIGNGVVKYTTKRNTGKINKYLQYMDVVTRMEETHSKFNKVINITKKSINDKFEMNSLSNAKFTGTVVSLQNLYNSNSKRFAAFVETNGAEKELTNLAENAERMLEELNQLNIEIVDISYPMVGEIATAPELQEIELLREQTKLYK